MLLINLLSNIKCNLIILEDSSFSIIIHRVNIKMGIRCRIMESLKMSINKINFSRHRPRCRIQGENNILNHQDWNNNMDKEIFKNLLKSNLTGLENKLQYLQELNHINLESNFLGLLDPNHIKLENNYQTLLLHNHTNLDNFQNHLLHNHINQINFQHYKKQINTNQEKIQNLQNLDPINLGISHKLPHPDYINQRNSQNHHLPDHTPLRNSQIHHLLNPIQQINLYLQPHNLPIHIQDKGLKNHNNNYILKTNNKAFQIHLIHIAL